MTSATRPPLPERADYRYELSIPTRWADEDTYGHVNNSVYYAYFDVVINRYLIEHGGLEPRTSAAIGLCVESHCQYAAPITFPEEVTATLRVGTLGNRSVRYEVGIFVGDELKAHGYFVHVFVDRDKRRPTAIAPGLRAALESLVVPLAASVR